MLLALYGAGLSTWLAVVQRRDKHPRVKVKATYGFLTAGSQLSEQQVLIEIANIGEKPITISSGGLLLPNKVTLMGGMRSENTTAPLPHELNHGKSFTMWFDLRQVEMALAQSGFPPGSEIRAKFCDQTSNVYLSPPLKVAA